MNEYFEIEINDEDFLGEIVSFHRGKETLKYEYFDLVELELDFSK